MFHVSRISVNLKIDEIYVLFIIFEITFKSRIFKLNENLIFLSHVTFKTQVNSTSIPILCYTQSEELLSEKLIQEGTT